MALYLVSTPIGNKSDITLRALETLKSADLIACEDTRTSGQLLKSYEISVPLTSFHEYTDDRKVALLVTQLQEGKNIAVITDAGTPGISDPGYPLVKAAIDAGVQVIAIPGASAFLAALTVSGFPLHRFQFLGFIPHKKGRETFFKELAAISDTCVFYESPHRIHKMAEQMKTLLPPDRPMCVARELTKIHEEVVRGPLGEVCDALLAIEPRGEYVVVVGQSE